MHRAYVRKAPAAAKKKRKTEKEGETAKTFVVIGYPPFHYKPARSRRVTFFFLSLITSTFVVPPPLA